MPHLEFGDLTTLLAQIAAIVFVSRVLGLVTRWLGQPLVIAEVLAGIVLGPSLLGWLWPEGMAGLFPAQSLNYLKMLSQIGLVLFMFLIGLELDPKLLKGRTHTSVVISHTSIALPFALGAGIAWWLYEDYSSASVPFSSFVLFLGVSMSVTAFPVLARILSERHLLTSRVGAIAIACAAVDDVTAWCLLAFVVAVARSQGVQQAAWTTVLAIAYIAVMFGLVRPFLRRVGTRVASRQGLTPTVVAAVLVLLIVSSIASEVIGIHALFGAFLFGAILPKQGKLAEGLIERLETVAVVLLLPLFFAYSGLRTQIGLVSEPHDWMVALALIAVATVGKFGGSAVAGRLTGLRWREASAIGILMNTRGLMELIVLNIGLDIGVISPTVFTMLVIMALVTTFATTPMLQWVYPQHELARDRLVEPAPVAAEEGAQFTVMMCVSDHGSSSGLSAVVTALMGRRDTPARLLALHLWPPTDRPSVEQRRAAGEVESNPLKGLLDRARDSMLEVHPIEFVSSDVGADICRTAQAMHASLVLIGAHRPLLLEGSFGGTVRDVVEFSPSPVGVFVDRGLQRVGRALVASIGRPAALCDHLARRIAEAGAEVTLLQVGPEARTLRQRKLTPTVDSEAFTFDSRSETMLDAADAVIEEQRRRAYDLIVLWVDGTSAADIRHRVVAGCSASVVALCAPAPPSVQPAASLELSPSPV